jgi:hypothetical protein
MRGEGGSGVLSGALIEYLTCRIISAAEIHIISGKLAADHVHTLFLTPANGGDKDGSVFEGHKLAHSA